MTIIAYIFTLEMKIGLQEKAEIGSKFLIANITVDWYINIVTVYFFSHIKTKLFSSYFHFMALHSDQAKVKSDHNYT